MVLMLMKNRIDDDFRGRKQVSDFVTGAIKIINIRWLFICLWWVSIANFSIGVPRMLLKWKLGATSRPSIVNKILSLLK